MRGSVRRSWTEPSSCPWARVLLLAGLACLCAGGAAAGDRGPEHVGLALNTGIGSSWANKYVTLGAAVDVTLARGLAFVADAQVNGNVENEYDTLTAGLRLRPGRLGRLSPYVTLGAGLWARRIDPTAAEPAASYGFAGLGISLRMSRHLRLFGEARPTLWAHDDQQFRLGTSVLVGLRWAV